MPMKLKLDDAGHVVLDDGRPVYVGDDGREVAYDAEHSRATITRLQAENKSHREGREQAEAKLKSFDGLDPEAARRAFETLKNLDDKKLIDAGQVEKVKQEAKLAFEDQLRAVREQYKPVEDERDSLRSQLHHERLSAAFGRSKYIGERLAIPVDMVQSRFGAAFGVGDDGKVVARGADGNPIYSRARPGEVAEFDEALEILVDAYPYRDHILKGTGMSGSGANGLRTGADGKRQVSRAAFDRMAPAERAKVAAEAAKGAAVISD